MNLSDLSIKNPVFAWMLMAFLVVFGGLCWWRTPISQMPDVDFPMVGVSVTLEGASPEIMETDVIDVLEDQIVSVEGIRDITSTAKQGRASLSIEFDLSKDIDVAVQEIQTKIAQAARELPKDVDPAIVTKQNADDQMLMWVSLSGHVSLQELTLYARNFLKDKLQQAPGVGDIYLGGYLDRAMRVWLKLEELEARELTVVDVVAALRREHVEVPAGRIESGSREMNVRSEGEAPSAEQFRKIVVAYRNEAPVFLEHVAVVQDGLADRRRIARAMGVPAVGLGIKKQFGANAVDVARGVRMKVEELQGRLPAGMALEINSDRTVFVEESIHEIQMTLVLSVLLTSLVCWIFLGSWGSTFNILLSIPTSIVGSFILIYFLGFTLNTFTLLALSLAVGIVVDDAIMVLENIVRYREKGQGRAGAASRGAREITMAAIAATLAIIAIFLPIAFIRGLVGKFLYQFGVTLSIAVALSLLEALTLTPMRCAQMLDASAGVGGRTARMYGALAGGYRAILSPCLRHPWTVLALSIVLFAGSLFFIPGFRFRIPGTERWAVVPPLRGEIVPSQDQSIVVVRMNTPVGSSIDYTDERVQRCEEWLSRRPAVLRYFASIGGFDGGEVDTAFIFITLKPRAERPGRQTHLAFMEEMRRDFNSIPGLIARPTDISMAVLTPRGTQFSIQFVVAGPDWNSLGALSEAFVEKVRESGLMVDAKSDYQMGMPEARIVPDRPRAADLGGSMLDIGDSVNALVGGVRAAKFKDGGHRFDVRVRLLSDRRSRPEDVKRLSVRNAQGKLVRLSELVQVKETPSLQVISRRNRSRAVTISANVAPGRSQKEANDRIEDIAREILPAGYSLDFTGSSALFSEGGLGFGVALGLGALIAYMVLASQFNSFVHPFLVLLAMPFSVTGAIFAMQLADVSMNLYSMIGVVLLMGLVKKNSILLIEFTNHHREHGLGVREALLEACPVRLRPILMTSISTIAAAVPAALALGPGSETRVPMAVVVIGGMILSTLFTLLVVPCAYLVLPGRVRRPSPEEGIEFQDEASRAAMEGSAKGR